MESRVNSKIIWFMSPMRTFESIEYSYWNIVAVASVSLLFLWICLCYFSLAALGGNVRKCLASKVDLALWFYYDPVRVLNLRPKRNSARFTRYDRKLQRVFITFSYSFPPADHLRHRRAVLRGVLLLQPRGHELRLRVPPRIWIPHLPLHPHAR